jgi:chromosome segregation ATPase
VRVLNESLEKTNINDRTVKMDNLVRDLEIVRQDLLNKIKAYERDRRDVSASFDRLMIINRILSGDNNRYKATEFHNLKFQLSDAENRLTRLREIRSRKDQLEQEIDDLPPVPEVPQDIKKPLLDLWSRHNNKAVELSKLKAELSPQENMFKEKQDEIKVRLGNLSVFTQEEAHMVSSLAGSMQTAEEELNGLLERRQNERDKFSQDNENKDIDEIKKSLTSLESEGVDNARSYNSLIVAFQEQLEDSERNLHQSRAKQKELTVKREEIRKKKQLTSIIVGFVAVMLIVLGIVMFVLVKTMAYMTMPLVIIGLIALAISGVMITPVFKPQTILKSEFAATDADVNRIAQDMQDKQNKVGALEIKLDTLARKVGLSNRKELAAKLEEYSQQASKLKELTLLEQLVEQKEQVVKRYKTDLQKYLEKASKTDVDSSAATARELSSALSQYMDETRQLAEVHHEAASNSRKFASIEEEIIDNDKAILNLFRKSGADLGENDAAAMEEVSYRLNNLSSLLKLQAELESMEQEIGVAYSELPGLIKNVEDYQSRVVQQLESIKQLYPGIETSHHYPKKNWRRKKTRLKTCANWKVSR